MSEARNLHTDVLDDVSKLMEFIHESIIIGGIVVLQALNESLENLLMNS